MWGIAQSTYAIDWNLYHLNANFLPWVLLIHALGLGLAGVGWAVTIRQVSVNAPFWRSVSVYLLSNVGRNIPGSIWYIAGRVYLHRQTDISGKSTVIASSIELIFIGVASILSAILWLLIDPVDTFIPKLWLWLFLGMGLLFVSPPLFNPLINRLIRIKDPQGSCRVNFSYGIVGLLLLIYVLVIAIGGLMLFLIINSLYTLSWQFFPAVSAIWGVSAFVTTVTFWIPGRMALRDGALLLGLSELMPLPIAVVITIVWHGGVVVSELFWALIAMLLGRRFIKPKTVSG
ncbi:MAG: hypothetical protein JXA21_02065 [Anaerolineae bacterium]|nr:hypothetical protein [Anaerolineae bacterium]